MLDHVGCGILGNGINVRQSLDLDCGNAFLGIRHPGAQLGLGRSPLGFRRCLGFLPRSLGYCRSLLAGIRQFLLVGSNGVVRFFLQAIGFIEILGDPVAPVLQNTADAGTMTFDMSR